MNEQSVRPFPVKPLPSLLYPVSSVSKASEATSSSWGDYCQNVSSLRLSVSTCSTPTTPSTLSSNPIYSPDWEATKFSSCTDSDNLLRTISCLSATSVSYRQQISNRLVCPRLSCSDLVSFRSLGSAGHSNDQADESHESIKFRYTSMGVTLLEPVASWLWYSCALGTREEPNTSRNHQLDRYNHRCYHHSLCSKTSLEAGYLARLENNGAIGNKCKNEVFLLQSPLFCLPPRDFALPIVWPVESAILDFAVRYSPLPEQMATDDDIEDFGLFTGIRNLIPNRLLSCRFLPDRLASLSNYRLFASSNPSKSDMLEFKPGVAVGLCSLFQVGAIGTPHFSSFSESRTCARIHIHMHIHA
ncbi:unnamed protein product [Protopolystoma xenopodis]|uniref:Uncharacterized protein n=1 Tax=Protopolystoma xenopodis TaxID=117903 RepID=A0A448XI47_9PLAT|nr:unnamed protein product [Protopolystoma xenopodis]